MPRTKEEATGSFPWVVFCAPISQNEDYIEDIQKAMLLWDRRGSFVYTSSIGIYPQDDGGVYNEDAPIAKMGTSQRLDRSLMAEQTVLKVGLQSLVQCH